MRVIANLGCNIVEYQTEREWLLANKLLDNYVRYYQQLVMLDCFHNVGGQGHFVVCICLVSMNDIDNKLRGRIKQNPILDWILTYLPK